MGRTQEVACPYYLPEVQIAVLEPRTGEEGAQMSLRRLAISRKFGKHRYAILTDQTWGKQEAVRIAGSVRRQGYSVRVVKSQTGWSVYHYPQYPQPVSY